MKFIANFAILSAVLSQAALVLGRPAAHGAAAALARRRTCTARQTRTEDFDDANLGLGILSPLLSENPTLKNIDYPGFSVTNGDGSSLLAESGDQVLVNGIGNELLQTTGAMQVDSSTRVTYFDLKSFYFGCDLLTKDLVNVDGLVPGLPTPCIVTIKGYYQSKLIGQQQFEYNVGSGLRNATLQAGKCHTDFQGVDRVEFTSDNPVLKAIVLDEVEYTPHYCTE